MSKIKFYGSQTCSDCRRSRNVLDSHNIAYEYINIAEVDSAAEEIVRINNGMQSTPTIVFPDGSILVEPTDSELKEKIKTLAI